MLIEGFFYFEKIRLYFYFQTKKNYQLVVNASNKTNEIISFNKNRYLGVSLNRLDINKDLLLQYGHHFNEEGYKIFKKQH